MSAVPGPPVDSSPTTTASPATTVSPAPELSGPIDMRYYLTEGLEGAEHQKYSGGPAFTEAIESKAGELRGQYVVFSSVGQKDFARVNRIRDADYKGLRFLYLDNEETLIVKTTFQALPGLVSARLLTILTMKIFAMGLDDELWNVGSTSFKGKHSSKEAYCGFKPGCFRPYKDDWPTLVLECGVSKCGVRLGADASWWLQHSQEEVKIVLVLKVSEEDRKIELEQWEMDTRTNPHGSRRPMRTQKVTIVAPLGSRAVATAPFSLNFNKIFLRDPDPAKGEKDIVFSKRELEKKFAQHVWKLVSG